MSLNCRWYRADADGDLFPLLLGCRESACGPPALWRCALNAGLAWIGGYEKLQATKDLSRRPSSAKMKLQLL